uniref:Uncharacterized protein n=1 Tax=Arundo donax TaxID=35708 RepID=A0A0A8ZGZ9_ARUDO
MSKFPRHMSASSWIRMSHPFHHYTIYISYLNTNSLIPK